MSGSYANRVTRVPLDHLVANPYQPRFEVNDEGIEALVDSIREYGFVGHVEVRRNPADPALPLQIVFGHRRVEAAKRAGLATIPAAIVDRSDDQMRRLTFVENSARKDLSYWEEAVFVGEMRRELNLSVRQLAAALGKPKSWVQERLDILRLPAGPLREAAQRDEIAFSAAWLLVQMEPKERDDLFRAVKRGDLNVSDLRALRRARLRPDLEADGVPDEDRRAAERQAGSPSPREDVEGAPHGFVPRAKAAALEHKGPLLVGSDARLDPGSSSPRSAPGRVIEVPLAAQNVRGPDARMAAGNRPNDPAASAAMITRTSVLALIREMEGTSRSLRVRLRELDFALLSIEDRASLDRAKTELHTVLAGIRQPPSDRS